MYTIKQIFTSVNYTNILNSIQEFFSKDYFNHIKDTVFKSINCKNFDFARIEYQCPHCGSHACKPVTCKTKFCSCCSKIYTENWVNKLNQQMINQKHKHLLFTIPVVDSKKIYNGNLLIFFHTQLLNILNSIWKNQIDFFIDAKGTEIYNSLNALKYLGRYLARPPLAKYRIVYFDGNTVIFWYEQLPEKNKVFLELPVEKFVQQLVAHIPPKGFKMIRIYGLYSRNFSQELKKI